MNPKKFIIGGKFRSSPEIRNIIYPYTGEITDSVFFAGENDIREALDLAELGSHKTKNLTPYKRAVILHSIADSLAIHEELLVNTLIQESGKTYQVAEAEVRRSRETITASAEEATRVSGKIVPLDGSPAGDGYTGFLSRVPVGIVLGITPFNYPLNLACHKIGPAIASGNAVILKPSSKTPLSSLLLGKFIIEAGFPEEAISVIPCNTEDAEKMVRDKRIGYVSFTGSPSVGWYLRSQVFRRIGLELGGNAGVIIHHDADLVYAAKRVCSGGFGNAGQSCISVQRVFVHEDRYDIFIQNIKQIAKELKSGDPYDKNTDIGPMISTEELKRVMDIIDEAKRAGAEICFGGEKKDALLSPTVLLNTTPSMRVNSQEIFAPVITITPYRYFAQALDALNQSEYGLQAGVFTSNIGLAFDAFKTIETGAVIINDIPTFRVDSMPYGGLKLSGIGREGPRYAIEEMTDMKMLVIFHKSGS
ncbi:MAG: aldehyde dehydrogenase family protein [Methanospirillaceae archaeon]|nr:aldehyde dehydrogenase family protein [Methanospirillaceae archaeon]